MRKVKFRGKSIVTGEWVYGYLLEEEAPLECLSNEVKPSDFLICKSGFADWSMPRPMTSVKVHPESVGQYIGVTDKDGLGICEGDILLQKVQYRGVATDKIFVVRWREGYGEFNAFSIDNSTTEYGTVLNLCFESNFVKVIGNAFDNPELLKP